MENKSDKSEMRKAGLQCERWLWVISTLYLKLVQQKFRGGHTKGNKSEYTN